MNNKEYNIGDKIWFADYPTNFHTGEDTPWTYGTVISYDEYRDAYQIEYAEAGFGRGKITRLACDMRVALNESFIDEMVAL